MFPGTNEGLFIVFNGVWGISNPVFDGTLNPKFLFPRGFVDDLMLASFLFTG